MEPVRPPAGGRVDGAGDRLVLLGAALFAVGLLATLVTIVPFFLGSTPFPTPVYLLASLAPVGFLVAALGLLRSARTRRRRARPARREGTKHSQR